MKPILVIAAQPTVDRTVIMPDFITGMVHRVEKVAVLPSGKALNAARTLNRLGLRVNVIALLAGHSGAWIQENLESEGITVHKVEMEGENRVAYSIYDDQSDRLTELIEDIDGPINLKAWENFYQTTEQNIDEKAGVVISGRGPRGFPKDGYFKIIKIAREKQIPVFIDSYGHLLDFAIKAKPNMLKINRNEAGKLIAKKILSLEDSIHAAKHIQSLGVEFIILTSGPDVVTCAYKDDVWVGRASELKGAAIGSGDVMMAGLVFRYLANASIPNIVQFGIAMGAANVLVPGAGLFHLEDVNRLITNVEVRQIYP